MRFARKARDRGGADSAENKAEWLCALLDLPRCKANLASGPLPDRLRLQCGQIASSENKQDGRHSLASIPPEASAPLLSLACGELA